MRLTSFLRASPLLFLGFLIGAAACGGSVVAGTGGAGTGGAGAGPIQFDDCTGPGQCVIVNKGCCDPCGPPELADVAAINGALVEAFEQVSCPEPMACPKCATGQNPNLFATCDNGTCRAADARTHEVSACTADADCTLRYGTACCEPCADSEWNLIGVKKGNALLPLVCAPDTACPPCAPTYPMEYGVLCQAGHCRVVSP